MRKAKIVGIEKESTKAPSLLSSKFILLSSSVVDYLSEISADSQISPEDKDLVLNLGNGILY